MKNALEIIEAVAVCVWLSLPLLLAVFDDCLRRDKPPRNERGHVNH